MNILLINIITYLVLQMYVELVESKQRKHARFSVDDTRGTRYEWTWHGFVRCMLLSFLLSFSLSFSCPQSSSNLPPSIYRFAVCLCLQSYESSPIPSKRRTRCQVGLDCANTIVPYTHSFESFNRNR